MACQCLTGRAGISCWRKSLQPQLLLLLQSMAPIAVIGRLHYAPLTDLAWSPDGAFLAIASQDNYCRWAVSCSCRPGLAKMPTSPGVLPGTLSWPTLLCLQVGLFVCAAYLVQQLAGWFSRIDGWAASVFQLPLSPNAGPCCLATSPFWF